MQRLASFMFGETEDAPVLEAARQFAERFECYLDVCHPLQDSFQFYAMSQGAVINPEEDDDARTSTVQSAFASTCGDYKKAYFFVSKSDMDDAISGFGLYYDAIVLGRR